MKILVWNEHQRVPVTVYGKAHAPGNFTITVCGTREKMDAARASDPDAIVYNFGGCGGGGWVRP